MTGVVDDAVRQPPEIHKERANCLVTVQSKKSAPKKQQRRRLAAVSRTAKNIPQNC